MYYSLRNSKSRTSTSASAKFTDELVAGKFYRITGTEAFWYKFDVTGGSVAASGDGAIYMAAGQIEFDSPPDGLTFLHVIRASADGAVNVAEVNGTI